MKREVMHTYINYKEIHLSLYWRDLFRHIPFFINLLIWKPDFCGLIERNPNDSCEPFLNK
jgi:hypothetical protein